MTAGRRSFGRVGTFLLIGGLSALILPAVLVQADAAGDRSPFPAELLLRPEAFPNDLERLGGGLGKQVAPFLKEPEIGKGPVFRYVLRFGKDTNNAVALLWDRTNGKLYLDLNHNTDLTDDPAGVFVSPHVGHFTQTFTNVTLPLRTAERPHPAILTLTFASERAATWSQLQVTSRSIWQAKVVSGGAAWQVAVLDSLLDAKGPVPGKFFLLRPWEARTNYVYIEDPRSGLVAFPERLFWLGQAVRLERHFETNNGTPLCRLKLSPQPAPVIELKRSGDYVYYATLRDAHGYTAVLREPGNTIQLPQGRYTLSTVWLKKGDAEAWLLPYKGVVLDATNPTNVCLGGPLTNRVAVARQGRTLNMNYQLVGAGGASYQLMQQDREKPPEFAVYHQGRKVFSGKFAYG
jgi:hypothetical protein